MMMVVGSTMSIIHDFFVRAVAVGKINDRSRYSRG